MKKIFGFALLCFFLTIGTAISQSTDTREFVAETIVNETTPEEAIDSDDGDFVYIYAAINQYTPNVRRQHEQYIRELIEEGIIPKRSK